MKKALSKVLAIIVTVALMATASIIMTATAEDDVVTNYLNLLPVNYEAADKIFDVANESHSRVTMTNWKFWGGSAAYPTLEDQYGLTRVNADYAYLDIAVENATEYFAVGMMVHKNYFQNGKCENYYYVSENGENWKPIQPIGTAVPEISPHYGINFADTDYRVEVDVIGNLPEGSNYVRVLTVCPSAAWTPIIDFVNIYDLGYNYAASLYPETPAVSVEDPYWDATDFASINGTLTNLQKISNGLNYHTDANGFGLIDPSQAGYVTLDVNSKTSVETVLIFDKTRQMSVSFEYKASISADAEWLPLGKDSIAMKRLNNADAASASIQSNANYELYAGFPLCGNLTPTLLRDQLYSVFSAEMYKY